MSNFGHVVCIRNCWLPVRILFYLHRLRGFILLLNTNPHLQWTRRIQGIVGRNSEFSVKIIDEVIIYTLALKRNCFPSLKVFWLVFLDYCYLFRTQNAEFLSYLGIGFGFGYIFVFDFYGLAFEKLTYNRPLWISTTVVNVTK